MGNNNEAGCAGFMFLLLIVSLIIGYPSILLYLLYAFLLVCAILIILYISDFIHSLYLIKTDKEFKEIITYDTTKLKKELEILHRENTKYEATKFNSEFYNYLATSKIFK